MVVLVVFLCTLVTYTPGLAQDSSSLATAVAKANAAASGGSASATAYSFANATSGNNGGKVCGKNETFAYCSVECPNNFCPTNDNRGIIACDPPNPCPSGCSCEEGYRRKSAEDKICILASDCPPVKCTRPNEEWNSCPGRCYSDSCRDRGTQPGICYGSDCNPQCVCKKEFFRNDTENCVPAEECSIEN